MTRLDTLTARFPEAPAPAGAGKVLPFTRHGDVVYLSGQVAFRGGELPLLGKVGDTVSVEQAKEEAARCVANALYRIQEAFGSLDVIDQVLKVVVFVNAVPDFADQPEVGHGASDFLVEVLGDAGRHARSAVGVGSLPLGVCVEVEMVLALTPGA